MNNTIDIKRLGLLMRWDLLTFRKGYTFSTLACIIAYSLYSLVGINNLKGVVMYDFDGSLVGTQKHYLSEESVFFGLLCFIVFYVMASCIFNNLRTKTYRENFLMLPASNIHGSPSADGIPQPHRTMHHSLCYRCHPAGIQLHHQSRISCKHLMASAQVHIRQHPIHALGRARCNIL